ncbi:MAG: hypothetical protein LKI24_02885 [Acidipropionibacterium sp.]|jgi:hypothetical protein|nr:hypothetical protein [Acidipropionibacterium sp.]
MRISLRRGAAACLCVLTMSSLSACGGQKSGTTGASSPAVSAPASGVSATPTPSPTPSYPFTVGPVADAKNLGTRMAAALKTVKSYSTVGEMKLTAEKTSASVKFSGDVDQSDPAVPKTHVKMVAAGKAMEIVSVGPKVWVKNDGSWVEGGSQQADQVDQTQALAKWGDAVVSAKYVGEDATGHHFEVTADPKKMLSTLDADTAAKIGPVPADYWLDDEFRLVKVAMKITEGGTSISSITTVSGINQPVTIPKVA